MTGGLVPQNNDELGQKSDHELLQWLRAELTGDEIKFRGTGALTLEPSLIIKDQNPPSMPIYNVLAGLGAVYRATARYIMPQC